jgi:hypothetical protein
LAVLTAYPVGPSAPIAPATINLPCLLLVPPALAVSLSADNTGDLAMSQFGGGWNTLEVAKIANGTLTTGYSYTVEETYGPRFVLSTAGGPPKQQVVSARLSGYQLGIIALQTQDGQQVPHVSGIVGTSQAPVTAGRVFGDLSTGLPATLSVVYLAGRNEGALAPNGSIPGPLSLAGYDVNADKLGTPTALLPDMTVSAFDIALAAGTLCLFAVTGTGAPLLALFDESGKALDAPASPAGSWSNARHWVTSPTVVPTQGTQWSFSFAFTEMVDGDPVAIYTGTARVPVPSP